MSSFPLNREQQKAANAPDGAILIVAGAGSGKTRVLTERISFLITEKKVSPERILSVTFTNKAAQEMRERLEKSLGVLAHRVWLGTFHSICLRLLRMHAPELGFERDFTVYDTDDSKSLMKQLLKETHSEALLSPSAVLSAIDKAKNNLITPQNFLSSKKIIISSTAHNSTLPETRNTQEERATHYTTDIDEKIQQLYELYQKRLFDLSAMDFGDLIFKAIELLEKNDRIKAHYQDRFMHVLIDEFQDTNLAQYILLKILTGKHKNIFAVGDEDQSIYAFRGANIENIRAFEEDFPGTTIFTLEQNYRSTQLILDAANSVIINNAYRRPKNLWTEKKSDEKISVIHAYNEEEEAKEIALSIKKLLVKGTSPLDIAIFYRTNAQSRAIEESLMYHEIPYKIFGGVKFFERKEIKDLIAYLRLIKNPKDDVSFARIINTPTRGIGQTTLLSLHDSALKESTSLFFQAKKSSNKKVIAFTHLIESLQSKGHSIETLLEALLAKTEYKEKLLSSSDPQALSRIENISELIAMTKKFSKDHSTEESISAFLDHVALLSSSENEQESKSSTYTGFVSLMTLHIAKGLEFPTVFLTGLEEGTLPHQRSLESEDDIDEERRLCYVGITRAKDKIFLSHVERRSFMTQQGYGGYRTPSRFLLEIPPPCFDEPPQEVSHFEPDEEFTPPVFQRKNKIKNNSTFSQALLAELSKGNKVKHAVFGEGEILSTKGDPTKDKDAIVEIKFFELEEPMRLMAQGIKLEIIT